MRTKKAGQNLIISSLTVLLGLLPIMVVRQAVVETLGNEFLGLFSLFTSIVGLLALAELGVTTAIVYALYKPFADDDRPKIAAYIRFYTAVYRWIGFVILLIGLAVVPFLGHFVQGVVVSEAQLYYVLFLANTVITYFFSAKLSILIVAQEGYKIAVGLAVSKFLASMLQLALLSVYPNFYCFLLIQFGINILYVAVMNSYTRKRYAWIYKSSGTLERTERTSLIKTIKALFLHKVGEVLVFSTDNLLISYFISLTAVGIFNSYLMIVNALINVVSSGLSGVTASIGNLMVEGDKRKVYAVHKRMFFFCFWIVSFLTISLWNTIEQFVVIWLGKEHWLDGLTISLMLLNFYFLLMRASIEKVKEAGGLHHQDRYAAIIEGIVNLVASLILVRYIGLPGVLLGTLISNFCVVFWVKPYFVYKYIFKEKLSRYFLMYAQYGVIALIPLGLSYFATSGLHTVYTVYAFVLNCIVNILIINVTYLIVFWKNEDFLYFKQLLTGKLRNRWHPVTSESREVKL